MTLVKSFKWNLTRTFFDLAPATGLLAVYALFYWLFGLARYEPALHLYFGLQTLSEVYIAWYYVFALVIHLHRREALVYKTSTVPTWQQWLTRHASALCGFLLFTFLDRLISRFVIYLAAPHLHLGYQGFNGFNVGFYTYAGHISNIFVWGLLGLVIAFGYVLAGSVTSARRWRIPLCVVAAFALVFGSYILIILLSGFIMFLMPFMAAGGVSLITALLLAAAFFFGGLHLYKYTYDNS